MTTIYQAILDAGIECSNWQSDLYVPNNQAVKDILNKPEFALNKANAKRFTSQIIWESTGSKASIDIPFAYDPFWSK